MRSIGNYSQANVERKLGTLVSYNGGSAVVRFFDGQVYGMPMVPFRNLGLQGGDRFVLVVQRHGTAVVNVTVEPHAAARPAQERGATPKIQNRVGRRLITRRGAPKKPMKPPT